MKYLNEGDDTNNSNLFQPWQKYIGSDSYYYKVVLGGICYLVDNRSTTLYDRSSQEIDVEEIDSFVIICSKLPIFYDVEDEMYTLFFDIEPRVVHSIKEAKLVISSHFRKMFLDSYTTHIKRTEI